MKRDEPTPDAETLPWVRVQMEGLVGSTFDASTEDRDGHVWSFRCMPDDTSGDVLVAIDRVDATMGTLFVQATLQHPSRDASRYIVMDGSLSETSVELKLTTMHMLMDPSSGFMHPDGDIRIDIVVWDCAPSSKRFKASGSDTTSNSSTVGDEYLVDETFLTAENRLDPSIFDDDEMTIDEESQAEEKRLVDLATSYVMQAQQDDEEAQVLLARRKKGAEDDTVDLTLPSSYDSKTTTGMVGLKNQGATCYMNSLLQTLFHMAPFRKAVYDTPTADEDSATSVVLALQRVFYRLETADKAVSTKELTKSFGWSHMDAFTQHDVQELYRILCDRLEEKMKGTPADGLIKALFEGKVKSFISCVHVPCESSREESFYDLQLDVKGLVNLDASFEKYIEVEMLDGENQYDAKDFGKQDAKKGLVFESLPPVLNLQLKRFEYDPLRDGMVKVHDRFEFPKRLDLSAYVPGTSPSPVYHLHSILVHSGDVHHGHYYVYVRPRLDKDWYKFDDDVISSADEESLLEGSYGRPPDASSNSPLSRVLSCSSAYMLVYLREDACPSGAEPAVIPDALKERFQDEEIAVRRRKRLVQREHMYYHLRIATDECLYTFDNITKSKDFCEFPKTAKSPPTSSTMLSFKVPKAWTVRQLYGLVHLETGVPIEHFRLWTMTARENRTHRPDEHLDTHLDATLQRALHDNDATINKIVPLYLEVVLPNTVLRRYTLADFAPIEFEGKDAVVGVDDDGIPDDDMPPGLLASVNAAAAARDPILDPRGSLLLFVKYYNVGVGASQRPLSYMGTMLLHGSDTVATVLQGIQDHAFGSPIAMDLALYEVVQPETVTKLDEHATLVDSELQSGDIVVFQVAVEDENDDDDDDADDESMCRTVPEYFAYRLNRVDVTFRARFENDVPTTEVSLPLLLTDSYDDVIHSVAIALDMDPLFVRLYPHSSHTHGPRAKPYKHSRSSGSSGITLKAMLMTSFDSSATLLYYERLDESIVNLERKTHLPVYLSPYEPAFATDTLSRVDLILEPTSTVQGALAEIARRHAVDTALVDLRLLETRDGSTMLRIVPTATPISLLQGSSLFVVDSIPATRKPFCQSVVLGVMHFSYTHDTFIAPHHTAGLVVAYDDDTFESLRRRVQAKFKVTDDVFAKWKLSAIVESRGVPLESEPGDMNRDVVFDEGRLELARGDGYCFLGLEYAATIAPSRRRADGGIKIRSG
ncbi:hypothetical protein SDRG_08471 [Saprolegnia diclina VS20]|uniref:ubiquitinyl hydrolase 1 n=1 Tax=Saprolegnia diclina (strain VS20) TaxID=1156394 RepID=T0RTV0_SAPDV|nr:hypothetical protein SDRG_08471 [Saprolegnia diclina VS20]EQC33787.1 hypothetical protein SDRG_08471 [Saprolegnia diclina VS20]|eukprot:XP_008612582.1 hypothetical protein SDRG_08471 [Saprolegnia diclina VS20]